MAGLPSLPARDRRTGQDVEAVGAPEERKPQAGVLGLRQAGTKNSRGLRTGSPRSGVFSVPNDGGDRVVSGALPRLWNQDRTGGTTTKQGAVQQTVRGGCRRGLRERIGATGGAAVRAVGQHSARNRPEVSGTVEGATAHAGAPPDGCGRDLLGQEDEIPDGGQQPGESRAGMVWTGTEEGNRG